MDSTFFRIVIAISGLLIIIGLVLWEWLHDKALKKTEMLIRKQRQEELEGADALALQNKPKDEALILPSMRAERSPVEIPERKRKATAPTIPKLIQLSVVAQQGQTFDGEILLNFLAELGLSQGDMGIYHRHFDPQSGDRFSIANLVEPGTFPADKQTPFSTPGIVLFVEITHQQEPLLVFDEMVLSSSRLSEKLDGLLLDNNHQPINAETLSKIRNLLVKK